MKRLLLCLFALFAMQIVTASENSGVCKNESSTEVQSAVGGYVGYVIEGSSNLTLVNGYAGTSCILYRLTDSGSRVDPPSGYRYEWSIQGNGRCYAWGSGRRCDVSVYHSGYGSARLICDVYDGNTFVEAATFYISYQ